MQDYSGCGREVNGESADCQTENYVPQAGDEVSPGLTALRNQERFQEDLESACAFASRQNLILSLVFLDLDEFKAHNNALGEATGDKVLRMLAETLISATRAYDVVGRQGEGTFSILLPSTDRTDACQIVDRLRRTLASHDSPFRAMTASFGIATLESRVYSAQELLEQARLALGQAKQQGRNRIAHFSEQADRSFGAAEQSRISRPKYECAMTD